MSRTTADNLGSRFSISSGGSGFGHVLAFGNDPYMYLTSTTAFPKTITKAILLKGRHLLQKLLQTASPQMVALNMASSSKTDCVQALASLSLIQFDVWLGPTVEG